MPAQAANAMLRRGCHAAVLRRCRLLRRAAAWAVPGVLLAAAAAWFALRWVPLPAALSAARTEGPVFVDRNGLPLRALPREESFHRRVAFGQIPEPLIQATLAAEDARFWRHPGVDWRATARAMAGFLRHGRAWSGGSTITQQLIKLAQPRPRTLWTKLSEAVQALRLEQVWDKQRILAEYLDRLDYGNRCTGCAEAAQFYFGKPVGDLSVAEAAFLAGLPQAPTRLNPHRHFERARKRQQWILERLHDLKQLTDAETTAALAEPVRLRRPTRAFLAPHFVDLVLNLRDEAVGRFTTGTITTTLDLRLNQVTESILRAHLAQLRGQHARNGAVVVLDNRSGDVIALVGSEDYFAPDTGQVNGAWARRSAGSTFKPFTYLLAFERGASPASVVADVPAEFPTPTGVFRPVNYDRRGYGPMRYRLALANSLNISAVKVLASVGGAQPLLDLLREAGMTALGKPAEFYGLGLTIGNAEARLLELANAYATLARLGEFRPYRVLADEPAPPPRRLAAAAAAWLVADVLSDNDARSRAFGWDSPLRFDFPVACKTGTSTDFRDNWAFGYTPEFTVGVWVGNFDGSPMQGVSGVSGAAPVLHAVLAHLHAVRGTSWYPRPADVREDLVDALTGRRLSSPRPGAVREVFLASSPPAEARADDYDSQGRVQLGAEYAEWLASGDNWLGGRAVARPPGPGTPMRITSPLAGSVYRLDPDLPESGRWLPLHAEGPAGLAWRSETLEIQSDGGRPRARLVEGRHRLIVRDAATRQEASVWIEVKRL